jgi:hypothetical protein
VYKFVAVFGDMVKHFLSILLIGIFAYLSSAQQHQYDIWLMNKKIGAALVSKTLEEGGKERYKMISQAAAKIFFIQQSSEVTYDVIFKGGQLINSLYRIVKDDDKTHTTVQQNASKYHVTSTLGNRSFSGTITISSIQLYFREPVGVQQVFVERIGDFRPLIKTAPGVYEYTLPDGIRSIYRYRNGVLYEVEVKKGAGSVFMRPSGQSDLSPRAPVN